MKTVRTILLMLSAASLFIASPMLANTHKAQTGNKLIREGNGNSGHSSFNVTSTDNSISGVLMYANNASTGMGNSLVILRDDVGDMVATVSTSATGAFLFEGIPNGNYTLTASTSLPWGGVNSVDALLAAKHSVGLITLASLRLQAGDVNLSQTINSGDAFLIMRRFSGFINAFPAGDWHFQTVSLNLSSNTTITQNIKGICIGDCDGSYTP